MNKEIKDYVVLDLESTGLYFENWDEIIEVAAIKVIDEKEETFHEHIKPYRDVSRKITEITKITNEFLSNKENKYKVLPRLREFIGDLPVVIHNVSFDSNFLNFWFIMLDLKPVTKTYCTMKNFKKHTGQKKSNLTFATDYFSIVLRNAHSALGDTIATHKLFKVLKEMYGAEYEELSERDAYLKVMKRVGKSNSHKKIRNILCDGNLPAKHSDSEMLSEKEIINKFKNFNTPVDVYKHSLNKYDEILNIFYDYLNMINYSKIYKHFSDFSIHKFSKTIIDKSNSINDLIELHKEIYNTEDINMFYYYTVYKIEKEKESMKYSTCDFDYYFSKGTSINELSNKIERTEDYVIKHFVLWAQKNKENKKESIKLYLGKTSDLKKALTNGPKSSKDKIMIALYNSNFFKI